MRHVRNHHSDSSKEGQSVLRAPTPKSHQETSTASATWPSMLPPGPSEDPSQSSRVPYSFGSLTERKEIDPFEGVQGWLEPSDLTLTANMWDTLPQFDFGSFTTGSVLGLSPSYPRQVMHVSPKDNIPDERYAKIASLWPLRKPAPRRLIHTLWRDVASYSEDNIFSQPLNEEDAENLSFQTPVDGGRSRWGLDEACRARLIRDCAPLNAQSPSITRGSTDESTLCDTNPVQTSDSLRPYKFPSTQILDISLDIYFRRFHHLMPFIHEPTFSAKQTPSILLFPMCLMGLTLLDSVRAKRFVSSHLSDAIERCRRGLVSSSRDGGQLGEFLAALAAKSLILTVVAISPKQAVAEQSRLLSTEALGMAQRHGLFVPQEGLALSSDLFLDFDNDNGKWKAWARVESIKRLIVCLLMSDSFFSLLDDKSPIIQTETLHFYFPCKNDLFQASTPRRWTQLVTAGSATIMPWMTPQFETTILPSATDANTLGFFGLFSTIWIRM